MLPSPLALAGGSFIFLAFVIALFAAVIWGYYTKAGGDIEDRPWSGRGGDAPGASTPSARGKDISQNVSNWSRGTGGKTRQRRMTTLEQQTAEAIDSSAGPGREPAWSARVGATVQLVKPVDPARDHIRGPEHAPVTLVEYGEYECPYCVEAAVVVRELEEHFGDSLRLVFRHFPLRAVHQHAQDAALAAEAAGRQGRFWEMHEALGRARRPLTPENLRGAAEQLGLDGERFAADMADEALGRRVEEDFQSGIASGANGAPTFFINNVRYDDDFDAEELGPALEAARDVAAKAGAGGVE